MLAVPNDNEVQIYRVWEADSDSDKKSRPAPSDSLGTSIPINIDPSYACLNSLFNS